MTIKAFNKRLALRSLLATSIALAGLYSQMSLAQGAGALTPGGVQPSLQRDIKPAQPKTPKFEVPPVADRPLSTDEGPRIVVTRFILEGIEDIPGADINFNRLVNRILEQAQTANPEGFTLGQLQETANVITQRFREAGLILAQAYVPAQKVENGVVRISFLPGTLGQLSSEDNEHYSDKVMQKPFVELLGKPVQLKDVESALLRMDDLPGLDAFGIFRPGKNIGETELVLKAKEEDPFEFLVVADNHGVQTTGEYRLIASLTWNNPTGNGDELNITALQTFDPEDSTYGALSYEIPVYKPGYSAGFSINTNNYEVSQSASPFIDGETTIGTVFGRYQFIRSRVLNAYSELSFSRKKADIDVIGFPSEDDLSVFSIALGFDNVDSRFQGINEGSVRYSQGLADFAGSMEKAGNNNALRAGSGGDFTKVDFDLTRLQFFSANQSLLMRLSGQHSDDLLSSIEQFSIGGPNSVRAYTVSEYVSDKGLFTSLEWILNAPGFANKPAFAGRTWGEVFAISIYADYAVGKLNDAAGAPEGEKVEVSGAGLGAELRVTKNYFLRLDIATPLGHLDASDDDNPQIWFSAGLEF
jgi:hemolysin activation/secretion protein